MWFIGQKIVCVNDRFPIQILEWASNLPREGRIYTIRWMGPGESIYSNEVKFGFLLEELQNGDLLAFFSERFVPLVERDQARQASVLDLIREVGDAAMKSVAEELKSETLPSNKVPMKIKTVYVTKEQADASYEKANCILLAVREKYYYSETFGKFIKIQEWEYHRILHNPYLYYFSTALKKHVDWCEANRKGRTLTFLEAVAGD
jgi:hypothetical protein